MYIYPSNIIHSLNFEKEKYLLLAYFSDKDSLLKLLSIKNCAKESGVYLCLVKNSRITDKPTLINKNLDSFLIIFKSFYSFFFKYKSYEQIYDKKIIWSDFENLTNLVIKTDKLSLKTSYWKEYWLLIKYEMFGEYLFKFPNPPFLKKEKQENIDSFMKEMDDFILDFGKN